MKKSTIDLIKSVQPYPLDIGGRYLYKADPKTGQILRRPKRGADTWRAVK